MKGNHIMEIIEYIGCFFEPQKIHKHLKEFPRQPLYRAITYPHVTLVYLPGEVPREAFGQKVIVRCVGYGCDGENEALLVEFAELPDVLQSYAQSVEVPHITLSVSKQGQSVNSKYLNYQPISPFLMDFFIFLLPYPNM